uniref:Uncharacterized protein n=2 Tax=Picea TaxID=3328 RepID=A0A101LVI3_PICGL|nr:hypothetical protein ABT39_MTgene1925 [Picea glauca]QHR89912.1 hypothetical protein Q903MT_gene3934 [Picea sitchensis]
MCLVLDLMTLLPLLIQIPGPCYYIHSIIYWMGFAHTQCRCSWRAPSSGGESIQVS